MNKLFTLSLGLLLGSASFGQVVFSSNLSDWTDGDPDDFMGSRSSIASSNVIEQTIGVTFGTSMAQLINNTGDHKRFTTQEVPVTSGEAYEIKMWVTGMEGSMLRTNFYDATNASYGTYNDYIDVFAETGGDLTMLSQTVVVPATCTDGEFIISIKDTDDMVGIVVDSVAIEVTAPPVAEEVTIYDIQYATEAPYISPYEDVLVQTSGIVTGVFLSGGDEGRFFIQDGEGAWNGVYVYDNSTELSVGDSVTVIGEVTEFYELTEINAVISVTVHSSGNALPAAVEVTTAEAANEEYEGVLVTVTNGECTNDDAGFGQFEVNDGSGARLIDDEMFAYTASLGNFYNVTGVTFLSFGEVKIYPRSIEDIEVSGYASISEENSNFSIYPNPASTQIQLSLNAGATVAIYGMNGQVVYTSSTTVNTIDVSNFDAGVYQVVITDNNTTYTEKLMVR